MTAPDLLRLADEELFVGHVLTARAGWGPELELNLAMSSMGQDEIGHARLLYGLVVGDDPAAVNAAVYDRPVEEFRVSALATVDAQDWAMLVVKHWLYELADAERVELLSASHPEVAARMRAEEVYHREFWTTWFDRTTRIDRDRVQRALDELWPGADELFAFESFDVASARDRWSADVRAQCAGRGLELHDGTAPPHGAAAILAEMRTVYATAPGRW